MRISLCPSSFMRAGTLTPSRSISVAKLCRRRCGVTCVEQPARFAAWANADWRLSTTARRVAPRRGSRKPCELANRASGDEVRRRSEERRVGKECRSGTRTLHEKQIKTIYDTTNDVLHYVCDIGHIVQ